MSNPGSKNRQWPGSTFPRPSETWATGPRRRTDALRTLGAVASATIAARIKSFVSRLLVRFGANTRGDEMTFFTTLPAIVLSRRPRHPGDDRSRAKSWLGGAPRLGGASWPRGADGHPFHFMAQ